MNASALRFRTARCVLETVMAFFLIVAVAVAEDMPAAPAAESLPDLSADFQTTLIDRGGHLSISTARIYRSGKVIRIEQNQMDPPEVSIIDFPQLKEFRLYAGDEIYFERGISERLSLKYQREGIIPVEANDRIVDRYISLRDDTIEGHPCKIIVWIRSVKDRKDLGSDYTFIWEAQDMNRQFLRVAYYLNNFTLNLVDFRNIVLESIDPALLKPPDGFASMTPF